VVIKVTTEGALQLTWWIMYHGIQVAISLAFVIYESARPHMAELGQLPGTSVYRNVEQYSEAKTVDGMIILRIDAPIYFANVDYVKDKLRHYELMSDKRLEPGQVPDGCPFVVYVQATG
jgi:sulfate transporter 4